MKIHKHKDKQPISRKKNERKYKQPILVFRDHEYIDMVKTRTKMQILLYKFAYNCHMWFRRITRIDYQLCPSFHVFTQTSWIAYTRIFPVHSMALPIVTQAIECIGFAFSKSRSYAKWITHCMYRQIGAQPFQTVFLWIMRYHLFSSSDWPTGYEYQPIPGRKYLDTNDRIVWYLPQFRAYITCRG